MLVSSLRWFGYCSWLWILGACASSVQVWVGGSPDAGPRQDSALESRGPTSLPTEEILLDELSEGPAFAVHADVLAVDDEVFVLEGVPPYSLDKVDRNGRRSRITTVPTPEGAFRLHRVNNAFAIVDTKGVTLVSLDGTRVEPRQVLGPVITDSHVREDRLWILANGSNPYEILTAEYSLHESRFRLASSCRQAGAYQTFGFVSDESHAVVAYSDAERRLTLRANCGSPVVGEVPEHNNGRILDARHALWAFPVGVETWRVAKLDLATATFRFGDELPNTTLLFSDDHGGYFAAQPSAPSVRPQETTFVHVLGAERTRGAWVGTPFGGATGDFYRLFRGRSACTATWCVQAEATTESNTGVLFSEVRIVDLEERRLRLRATTAQVGTDPASLETSCGATTCTVTASARTGLPFTSKVDAQTGRLLEKTPARLRCASDLCVDEGEEDGRRAVFASSTSGARWRLEAYQLVAAVSAQEKLVAFVVRLNRDETDSELGVVEVDRTSGPSAFRPLALEFRSEDGGPRIAHIGSNVQFSARAAFERSVLLRALHMRPGASPGAANVKVLSEFLINLDSLESRRVASWTQDDATAENEHRGDVVATPNGFAYFSILPGHNDAVVRFFDDPWNRGWVVARSEEVDRVRGTSRWNVGPNLADVRARPFQSSRGLIAVLLRDDGNTNDPVELVVRNLSDGAEFRIPDLLVLPLQATPVSDDTALIVYARASDSRICARLVPIPSSATPPR